MSMVRYVTWFLLVPFCAIASQPYTRDEIMVEGAASYLTAVNWMVWLQNSQCGHLAHQKVDVKQEAEEVFLALPIAARREFGSTSGLLNQLELDLKERPNQIELIYKSMAKRHGHDVACGIAYGLATSQLLAAKFKWNKAKQGIWYEIPH